MPAEVIVACVLRELGKADLFLVLLQRTCLQQNRHLSLPDRAARYWF